VAAAPAERAIERQREIEPLRPEPPAAIAHRPAAAQQSLPSPAPMTPPAVPAPPARPWNWLTLLPVAWAIGCCLLLLRLCAARWLLWRAGRQGAMVDEDGHDALIAALGAASARLNVRRRVVLIVHP